jgi:hypothetical protein
MIRTSSPAGAQESLCKGFAHVAFSGAPEHTRVLMKARLILQNTFLLAFAAALLLPSLCAGDPAASPEGFAGIKWGAAKQDATTAMAARDAGLLPEYSNEAHLGFWEGNIAGLGAYSWDLFFASDKFWRGGVQFKDASDPEALFKQVKKVLADKYGGCAKERFEPGSPSAEWRLVPPGAPDGIVIRLWLGMDNNQKRVKLEYTNEALAKLALEQNAAPTPTAEGL